jgi:hypothetical protein
MLTRAVRAVFAIPRAVLRGAGRTGAGVTRSAADLAIVGVGVAAVTPAVEQVTGWDLPFDEMAESGLNAAAEQAGAMISGAQTHFVGGLTRGAASAATGQIDDALGFKGAGVVVLLALGGLALWAVLR